MTDNKLKVEPKVIAVAAGMGAILGLIGFPGIPGMLGGAVCIAAAETAVEAFAKDSIRNGVEPKPLAIGAAASAGAGYLLFGAPVVPTAIAGALGAFAVPFVAVALAGGINGRGGGFV